MPLQLPAADCRLLLSRHYYLSVADPERARKKLLPAMLRAAAAGRERRRLK